VADKNIPINKGNYPMESEERVKQFHDALAEGWVEGYWEYRNNWIKFAKEQYVAEYPLLVDLELSSLCNLNCPMCYTITKEFKEKVNAKLMDFSMFKRIIDEIGGKVPAIRLSLRGEATLHKNFLECVSYAKSKGIKEISFLTNGGKLKPEFFKALIKAGADWITISFDGLGETYNKIRKPLKFEDMVENIKQMKVIKAEMGVKKPVIKVQSVWPAIRNNVQLYYDTFAPHVDLVAYNPLIDYLSKDSNIQYEENFSCPQFYQRIVVGADGRVMMCSNDEENWHVIGDTNKQTIHEIWHGDELNKMRELHKKPDGFKEIAACRKCYIPRLTDDLEKATVNGQEMIIKNYVNRAQEVGQ
jgi:radical SAM protein with 4Fe4S-binding SPASM domain